MGSPPTERAADEGGGGGGGEASSAERGQNKELVDYLKLKTDWDLFVMRYAVVGAVRLAKF